MRLRSPLRLFVLAGLSVGLLFAPSPAQAAATGRPVAWGCGAGYNFGQCSVPSGLNGVSAIAAGPWHSLALKGVGTVVPWGWCLGPCSLPSTLSGVTAIAAGLDHELALKGDGTVVAWGCVFPGYDSGQCSVPSGLSGVTAISAGFFHSLALKSDSTVVAWGCGADHDFGQCSVPSGLSGVTAISAGTDHSLALKYDGTFVAWGCTDGGSGQCSVPSGLSGVSAISAGYAHSLALKSDGTVVAWGCGGGNWGQCSVPSGLSGVTAISAGYYHSLALKGDGTVVAWGCGPTTDLGQCSVPGGLARVIAIAASGYDSLALIELSDQTIAFGPLANKSYGDPDFSVSGTASSGLVVSFAASGNCTVRGLTVHLTGTGSCTVTASQPGDANYNAAPEVVRTFSIGKAGQSIIFGPLANKRYGDADFTVGATASSGLAVFFAASGNCTVSGVTVHVTGAGSCTLTASQAGDANYAAAPDVSRTFSIAPAPCRVPKVVGKRVASAKRTIALRHCRVGKVRYVYSPRRKRGIVISQSRRPGRVLPARAQINLVVGRGRRR
jgi:alpha-tubulin suppressor-like RCC1 family protein